MKPEFMRVRRALSLAVATLVAAVAITVVSPAMSASAHHSSVSVKAACVDNEWTVTWTVTNSEAYKVEEIIQSNQPELVPVGTKIDAGFGTFTATEKVSGPITKTLTVKGHWARGDVTEKGSPSATVYPGDFKGSCTAPETTPPPSSPPAAPPAVEPESIGIASSACTLVQGKPVGTVTATAEKLVKGTSYRIFLWKDGAIVDTVNHTGDAPTFTTSFADRAPGDYVVSLGLPGGVELARTGVTTIATCGVLDDLVTLAPPTVSAAGTDCVNGAAPSITVTAGDLDATKTYYVRLVDSSGNTAAGGAEQAITGVTTSTVSYPSITAPGSFTAQLLIEPGRQLAAVDAASVVLLGCLTTLALSDTNTTAAAAQTSAQLPTLAITGPSELIPLAVFAALLLTLGGTVIMSRLRRRAAQ